MTENNMPVAEATSAPELELQSYELAFHVLPTVTEGEVATVFESLKAQLIKDGAEIFDEEAPKRFDLAYEIVKYLEGRNRKFSSAYFGWVRFKVAGSAIAQIMEECDANKALLRHLLIRLTAVEESHSFRFHDALPERQVTTITDEDIISDEEIAEVEAIDEVVEEADAEVTTTAEADSAETKETV